MVRSWFISYLCRWIYCRARCAVVNVESPLCSRDVRSSLLHIAGSNPTVRLSINETYGLRPHTYKRRWLTCKSRSHAYKRQSIKWDRMNRGPMPDVNILVYGISLKCFKLSIHKYCAYDEMCHLFSVILFRKRIPCVIWQGICP